MINNNLQVVVITTESKVANEKDTLCELLDLGATVHIRKPDYQLSELESLLKSLPHRHFKQLSIHDNCLMAHEFQLGGFHLKSDQQMDDTVSWKGTLSKSFHRIEDILHSEVHLSYAFLDPIFQSVSK